MWFRFLVEREALLIKINKAKTSFFIIKFEDTLKVYLKT